MYSQVELINAQTLRRQKLTICFPGDAEPAAGFISVLSPVGLSLIGLREGAVARWLTPSGEEVLLLFMQSSRKSSSKWS